MLRQRGAAYYRSLKPAARRQMLRELAKLTKDLDARYGTRIYQGLPRNGFPFLP